MATENQHWPFVIIGRESLLDPCSHGVPVDAAKGGYFFHGVGAMDFGETRVWVALSHGLAPPRYLGEHALKTSPAMPRKIRPVVAIEYQVHLRGVRISHWPSHQTATLRAASSFITKARI